MIILIENKPAVIKKGSSFEFTAENFLFGGAEDYTLSITFPLKDCPENIAIFGHLTRHDADLDRIQMDCEVRHNDFYRDGTLAVIEVNETEVKGQFLSGRSKQNFDTKFDDIYINSLSLGYKSQKSMSSVKNPSECWIYDGVAVALPWVREDSGDIMNCVTFDNESGKYVWDESFGTYISWQPYLLYIVKEICKQRGYTYDFSEWENHEVLKYLIICNTIPTQWEFANFARALPKWSLSEFFEKLELFLGGEFTISHKNKHISLSLAKTARQEGVTFIDKVLEEHSASIEKEISFENCGYLGVKNIAYSDAGHWMQKFYSCAWYIKERNQMYNGVGRVSTMDDLLNHWNRKTLNSYTDPDWHITGSYTKNTEYNNPYLVEQEDRYFGLHYFNHNIFGTNDRYVSVDTEILPINPFGMRQADPNEDSAQEQIDFVPVCIMPTEDKYGDCMFMSTGDMSSKDESAGYRRGGTSREESYENRREFLETLQPYSYTALENGEDKSAEEYFSKIFVGFWDGAIPENKYLPFPYLDYVWITSRRNLVRSHFSLSLTDGNCNQLVDKFEKVNPYVKYTFKFLAKDIPNTRSLFLINGKKYLCSKISCQVSEQGVSEIMAGEFFRIDD